MYGHIIIIAYYVASLNLLHCNISFSNCVPFPHSLCAVVVVAGIADQNRTVYDMASPYSEGSDFYITGGWDEQTIYAGRVPSAITVGDGDEYPTVEGPVYINVPLKPNLLYTIFTRYDIYNDANPEQVSMHCL